MLYFIYFNIFYFLFCFKGILLDNFIFRNNENFVEFLQKNGNYNIEILEAECSSDSSLNSDKKGKEIMDFDRKEFLMHDFIVIKNSKFSNDTALELYHIKERRKKSNLVLTFYIGDLNFSEDDTFPYEVHLILSAVPPNKKSSCKHNTYAVNLLKTIEVNNPSDFEIAKGPIKITISRTSGTFRINVTDFFKDGKWKIYSKDRISLYIEPEDYCYTKLENKLNKPVLLIEKKTTFYTEWGEWSMCSMTCDHPDNIQLRERKCAHANDDCFKGDLKETRNCAINLPKCNAYFNTHGFSTLKIVIIILPLVLLFSILAILYHIFYRKKGAEKELYENVAGRFMYE